MPGSRCRRTRTREYDEVMELDLSTLEPLIALPSSPDAVVPVREVAGTEVGAGRHRQLHELVVPGPDGGGGDGERQAGLADGQRRRSIRARGR